MRRYRRILVVLVFVVVLLFTSIGYAYLNTNLSINGTANISNVLWDVHWDNVQVDSGSVTDVIIPATIKTGNTEVEFDVNLYVPGDYYEFTVDAVNGGTIDAMISVITYGVFESDGITQKQLPDYLEYTVTYSDGVEIDENHLLEAGATETYRVLVRYKDNVSSSQLPTEDEHYVFKFEVNYVQSNNNAVPVRTTYYDVSSTETVIGYPLPNITTYNNYQDAIAALGFPTFLNHIVANNTIISSYIGFVINNNVYYIRGGVYESGVNDYAPTPIYDSNKTILQQAFGVENCSEWVNGYYRNYSCSSNVYGIGAFIATDGHIESGATGNCGCNVMPGGDSACNCD